MQLMLHNSELLKQQMPWPQPRLPKVPRVVNVNGGVGVASGGVKGVDQGEGLSGGLIFRTTTRHLRGRYIRALD